jgi:hypothetical protein
MTHLGYGEKWSGGEAWPEAMFGNSVAPGAGLDQIYENNGPLDLELPLMQANTLLI